MKVSILEEGLRSRSGCVYSEELLNSLVGKKVPILIDDQSDESDESDDILINRRLVGTAIVSEFVDGKLMADCEIYDEKIKSLLSIKPDSLSFSARGFGNVDPTSREVSEYAFTNVGVFMKE